MSCVNCGCSTAIVSSTGPKGDTGATGATGTTGATGATGAAGASANLVPVILATTSTVTLAGAADTGSTIYLNRASGVDVALPASPATGTVYHFEVLSAVTSNDYSITANGGNSIYGFAFATRSAASPTIFLANAAGTDHMITMNGSTTGGLVGTVLTLVYTSTNTWVASGSIYGSGAANTSFAP